MSEDEKGTLWIESRCRPLPITDYGDTDFPEQMVLLGDDRLLQVNANACRTSADDGITWSAPVPMTDGSEPGVPQRGAMVRTRNGDIVLTYGDSTTYRWGWNETTNEPDPDVRCDVWSIRSPDEGRTWTDRQPIFLGFCGAVTDIIETRAGNLVTPVQHLWRAPARHVQFTCVSTDGGRSWRQSSIIDLGGHGHHDGVCEGTVAELSDGRLLMLLRTNLDRFWEAYSDDGGLSWREIRPSPIDASSAPGYLLGLQSGRLALAWNRLYPQGEDSYSRVALPYAERPMSLHREELSLAFSDDDGRSWSEPVVIGRMRADRTTYPYGRLSYPYLFERRPGEVWVVTTHNRPKPPGTPLAVSVQERDFRPSR